MRIGIRDLYLNAGADMRNKRRDEVMLNGPIDYLLAIGQMKVH